RRNALRDLYWQRLGEYATERALAELPHASGDDALPALVGLCTGWARRDFHAAFQYVLQHVERRRLDVVLLPVIQSWARNGLPEDVSLVVEKLPPDLSERSLLGTIPILASVNPAASLEWSLRLSAGSIR